MEDCKYIIMNLKEKLENFSYNCELLKAHCIQYDDCNMWIQFHVDEGSDPDTINCFRRRKAVHKAGIEMILKHMKHGETYGTMKQIVEEVTVATGLQIILKK